MTALPKILFYVPALVDGGAERLWACLATAFHQRGYRVVFAVDFEADDNRHNLDPSIVAVTLGRNHASAIARLARLLREERPDVALSAVAGCNTKLLAAMALSRSGTRAILSVHGSHEYKTGLLSLLSFLSLPVSTRIATRTIAVSNGLRQLLINRWWASPSRTVTILNPVFFPADTPVPDHATLAGRDNIVLAVGRLVEQKDYPTLIRAFAHVRTPGARLVILGKGHCEDAIRAEISQLGLTSRVELAGYSREPWGHYKSAKCLAISSLEEQFGNVVVEALAHGLPVAATACTGPTEILQSGGAALGRIVPLGDEQALAEAIDAVLADTGDPAVRRRRADQFSFAARVPAYESLIAEVLGPAGRAGVLASEQTRSPF